MNQGGDASYMFVGVTVKKNGDWQKRSCGYYASGCQTLIYLQNIAQELKKVSNRKVQ